MPQFEDRETVSEALDYATARAKELWGGTHARGPFAWLLRKAGIVKPTRAIWICRHEQGDFEEIRCDGEPAQVWRYDAKGLAVIDGIQDIDSRATGSATPILRFYMDPNASRMVYTEWHGARHGMGHVLIRKSAGSWVVQDGGWIS